MSEENKEIQLLIELPESEEGIVEASLSSAEMGKLSMAAVDNAMIAIRYLGAKIHKATDGLGI